MNLCHRAAAHTERVSAALVIAVVALVPSACSRQEEPDNTSDASPVVTGTETTASIDAHASAAAKAREAAAAKAREAAAAKAREAAAAKAVESDICGLAGQALELAQRQGSISGINGHVNAIRRLNISRKEADGLYWQVWQLADAWDGAAALDGDPELGPAANGVVVASLRNLVAYCEQS